MLTFCCGRVHADHTDGVARAPVMPVAHKRRESTGRRGHPLIAVVALVVVVVARGCTYMRSSMRCLLLRALRANFAACAQPLQQDISIVRSWFTRQPHQPGTIIIMNTSTLPRTL